MRKEQKRYHMFQNSWFMVKLAWNSKEKKVLMILMLMVFLTVTSSVLNLYITPAILEIIEKHGTMGELLKVIEIFLGAMMLVSSVSAYLQQNKEFGRITIRQEIICMLNHKAANTSYPNLGNEHFQKLIAKSNEQVNSNESAAEAIWETWEQLLINIFGFLIYISLLNHVQPILIAVILLTTVVSYLISSHLNEYEYRHREEEALYWKHKAYLCTQARTVSTAKDIRIFGLRTWLEELYEKAEGAFLAFHRRAENIYLIGKIVDLAVTFLRNGMVYAYLISMVLKAEISVSRFLLFFSAVSGFTQWILGIMDGFCTLQKQSHGISIIRECLEFEEIFRFEEGKELHPEKKDYEICLKNVSFRYPGATEDTLKEIDLTIHQGEKLAVVGLNGAGKTTLVKLICGFLNPTEGSVLLNGIDIREYNRSDYYQMFSAVFQSFSILPGSISYNVAQGTTPVFMDKVKECIEKAGLRKKVEVFPKQYDTLLNRTVYEDAVMLSGGETQRLMLARALYKDAPILVLDEPTAALDPLAEADIYEKYNEMTEGKISVYISHRLASTRFCDRIILIDGGKICEEGTHEELLHRGGRYAEFYEIQSKYYREGAEKE